MRGARPERLKRALEVLRLGSGLQARVPQDPVSFPRRFRDPRDAEVAGWLAAALAYGRVPLFQAALEGILAVMGREPYRYALNFDPRRSAAAFGRLYYRLHSGQDIAGLLFLLRGALRGHGSVGAFFSSFYRPEHPHVGPALERFAGALLETDLSPVYGRRLFPRALSQFLALPSRGSACKRLNLYLRWMVRPDDGVDLGLWRGVPASALVVPLDTHVFRIARYLGLTRRRTPGWAAALEVTAALRRLCPEDPLRYDFPLCHHGISGACPIGRSPESCAACPLLRECAKGRRLARPPRSLPGPDARRLSFAPALYLGSRPSTAATPATTRTPAAGRLGSR